MRHRQIDSSRLNQRNRNLVKDILDKHATEQRRTSEFLRYALGKREKKSEEELKNQMKNSKYDPKKDPLMGRLFRKYDPTKSTILMSKSHGMSKLSNVSQFENGKIYGKGRGHGSTATYLCINPLRSMIKNREFALKKRSMGFNDTEKALERLEESFLQSSKTKPTNWTSYKGNGSVDMIGNQSPKTFPAKQLAL